MPRASINLEFEDGELRKFVEDGLRRWTLNTIHDLLKHLRDPNFSNLIMQAVQMGVSAGVGMRRGPPQYEHDSGSERGGAPPHQRPDGDGWVQGRSPFQGPGMVEEILRGSPGGPREGELKRCMPVEANTYQEEGWGCHKCSTYNSVQRSVCRQCKHERCDVVQPPPDDQGVPSGSA